MFGRGWRLAGKVNGGGGFSGEVLCSVTMLGQIAEGKGFPVPCSFRAFEVPPTQAVIILGVEPVEGVKTHINYAMWSFCEVCD